jgi:hypothetical protein
VKEGGRVMLWVLDFIFGHNLVRGESRKVNNKMCAPMASERERERERGRERGRGVKITEKSYRSPLKLLLIKVSVRSYDNFILDVLIKG